MEPILIWLHGEPGQGKSDSIPVMRKAILHFMKQTDDPYWKELDDIDSLIFTKSAATPYWDGYRNNPFFWCDDWGQIQTAEALSQAVADIICLVNTAPCPLNVADCNSKGTLFFNSRVIFITSNVTDFSNLKMANTGALGRRIAMAFKVIRGQNLKVGKEELKLSDFDNAWHFEPTPHIGEEIKGLRIPLMETTEFKTIGGSATFSFTEVVEAILQRLKRQFASETFADRANFQGFGDWWDWMWQKSPLDEDGTLIYATEDETRDFHVRRRRLRNAGKIPDENDAAKEKYDKECKGGLFADAPCTAPRVNIAGHASPPDFTTVTRKDVSLHLFLFDPTRTRMFTGEKIRRGIRNFFGKRTLNFCAHRKAISNFIFYLAGKGVFSPGDEYEWIRNCYRRNEALELTDPVEDFYVREWAYRKAQQDLMQEPIFTMARDEEFYEDDFFVPDVPVGKFVKEYCTALLCMFPNNKNVHLITTCLKGFAVGGVKCLLRIRNCVGGIDLIPTPECPVVTASPEKYSEELVKDPAVINLSFVNPKAFEFAPRTSTEWQATCMIMAGGMNTDLQTIRDIGTSICVVAVYMAAKSLFNVFFSECPTWFHAVSYTKNGNDMKHKKGGDPNQGNFSRNARAARLAKENVWHDHKGQAVLQSGLSGHLRDFSVTKNVWVLRLKYLGGYSSYCEGLFMDSRQIAFTWHAHAAYSSDVLVEIALFPDHPDAGVKTALVLSQSMFSVNRPDKNRDLGFVVLNKAYMQGVRSLWGLVPSRCEAQPTYNNVFRLVSGVYNGQNMTLPEGPFPLTLVKDSKRRVAYQDGLIVYEDTGLTYYIVAEGKGEAGDCGFPYMCATNDKPLLGMHHARCGNDSFMVPFYSEDNVFPVLQAGLRTGIFMEEVIFPEPEIPRNDPLPLPYFQHKGDFTLPMGLENKVDASVAGEHISGAKHVGKLDADVKSFSSPQTSKFFLRSPEYLEQAPQAHVKYPARMNRRARRNRLNATFNFGETPCPDLAHTEDPKWSRGFAPISKTFNGFLTFEQAVFGDPTLGLASFASSSKFVGHFFNENKVELVNFLTKTFHPKLKERVMMYFDKARKSDILPLVAQFAKDELLDLEKVEENICRLINGHDLAYNIFLRMLTGQYVNMINNHPARVVAATGINPLSHEWKVVHDTATLYDSVLAGDLSKQEATTNQQMRDAFIAHIASFYLLTEEEMTILRNGLSGLNSYYFEREGHLYMAIKGHSSGHFLTTIYNSFCTWFCHKTAFEAAFDPEEAIFEEEVALRTAGDDSFGSVSDRVKDTYDMLFISKFLKETMGIKYTAADKNAEIVPFVPLAEATFLGRSFRNHIDGRLVGPLRESAIHDLVIWSVKVPGFTQEQVDDIRVEQALRESVLHGHVFYNDVRNKTMKFYSERHGRSPPMPLFREMNKKVVSNWYKCDFDGLNLDRPSKAGTSC